MNVLKTLIVLFSLLMISLHSNAMAECSLFDQFDKPFDTFTQRKDCDEYCEARDGTPAYCKKISAKKIQQDIIFDNCVIAKSKGQLKVVQGSIRNSCDVISRNPSWFQKLKWGG